MKHSKRKHSDFAASAAYRWMRCPGSVRLARLAPAMPDSKYAIEGTRAHECLEFIVKRFRGGLQAATASALKKWPAYMVEHALSSACHVFNLKPSQSAELLIEQRVKLSQISPKFYGTLDYAWVDLWGDLVVIDYKFGAGVAVLPFGEDGKPNPQLMYYAAGLAHKYDYEFERVRLVVIQPRVCQDDESPVFQGTVKIKAIREFEKEVREAKRAAESPNAPLVRGDHCRWCPASATCPENSLNALADAEILFDVESGLQAVPEPLALTAKTLPKMLKACDSLEIWIKNVRERALKLAEDGKQIQGYKLVAKRGVRSWLPEAETKVKKVFGDDAYKTEKSFLSPAQLEKRHGARAKKLTQKYTASVSSGFNLVPVGDSRPEVKDTIVFDID